MTEPFVLPERLNDSDFTAQVFARAMRGVDEQLIESFIAQAANGHEETVEMPAPAGFNFGTYAERREALRMQQAGMMELAEQAGVAERVQKLIE